MIFSVNINAFESEKERNLYYKFFAGYFFNELIDGYSDRVSLMNEHLSMKSNNPIHLVNPAVSFDNHSYQLGIGSDKGEFADILLHDPKSNTMVAIEAKYLTNWSVNKDIESNLERINAIREKLNYEIHFYILVSKTKWASAEKMKNHKFSNYSKYIKYHSNEAGVLFWEDLVQLCASEQVRSYMVKMLDLVNKPKK
ncbi:hypothetical protein ACFOSS_14065 [Pseudaeromonas sharmana]|uniref:PD-(D/E)XK nuclease superfamily protein n=1 Tax=Pseudaeromonas sharmana TaxID=328412 RepID=A0ABV8CQU4_9GAMM